MEDKFEVAFLNELDTKIFDDYFYQCLLKNIVALTEKQEEKIENGCSTCACLEQVNIENDDRMCACLEQANNKIDSKTCTCLDASENTKCLS